MNPGGQMNMQDLLQQAQKMQEQLVSAQQELADAEIEGNAGGGLLKVRVSGQGELVGVTIDPKLIDTDDPADAAETISDLVLAAVRDASEQAAELQQQKMGPLAQGIGGGGGLELPGM